MYDTLSATQGRAGGRKEGREWGLERWLKGYKYLSYKCDSMSLTPRTLSRRELTFESCPLTSTIASWHMCAHVQTHNSNKGFLNERRGQKDGLGRG